MNYYTWEQAENTCKKCVQHHVKYLLDKHGHQLHMQRICTQMHTSVYVTTCSSCSQLPVTTSSDYCQRKVSSVAILHRSVYLSHISTSLSQITYMSLKYRCVPKRRQVLSSIAITHYRHSPFLKSNLLTHYYSNPWIMIHLPLLVYLPIVAAVTQCISQWFCHKLCSAITSHVKFNYFMGFSPSWLVQTNKHPSKYKFTRRNDALTGLYMKPYLLVHRCQHYRFRA